MIKPAILCSLFALTQSTLPFPAFSLEGNLPGLATGFITTSAAFVAWLREKAKKGDKIRQTKYLPANSATLINLTGERLEVRSFNGEIQRLRNAMSALKSMQEPCSPCCARRHCYFLSSEWTQWVSYEEQTNSQTDLFPKRKLEVHRYDIGNGCATIMLQIRRPDMPRREIDAQKAIDDEADSFANLIGRAIDPRKSLIEIDLNV